MLSALRREITNLGLSYTMDESGATICRRYARNDELGIPFAMTVDFDSLEDGSAPGTVTLRERDSGGQIRLPAEDVPRLLQALCAGRTSWADVVQKYGLLKG